MATLSNGTDTISPELVTGYQSTREPRTIVHNILGTSSVDVTVRPAGPRSGTLELLILSEADAAAAETALSGATVWTLTDADRSTIGMSFVVSGGAITRTLEDETRQLWLVSVPFVEVAP